MTAARYVLVIIGIFAAWVMLSKPAAGAQLSFNMPTQYANGWPLPAAELGARVYRKRIIGDILVASVTAMPGDHVVVSTPRDTGRWYVRAVRLDNGLKSAKSNTAQKGSGCYIACHGDIDNGRNQLDSDNHRMGSAANYSGDHHHTPDADRRRQSRPGRGPGHY